MTENYRKHVTTGISLVLCLGAWPIVPSMAASTPEAAVPNGSAVVATQPQKGRVVIGTVVDASTGETIIGASVVVKGTKIGAVTDVDGNFTINTGNVKNPMLEITYLGYKKKEVDVGDAGVLKVELQSSNEVLDEVVVVGAGSQKKVSITGAITAIDGSELKTPSSSLTGNFAGKLAGVVSMTNSGAPGSTSDFYIRGIGTFGGRVTPLILLDDVEISAADLNNIPAESIKSFSVLKDASATAIYGVRGANGVMLVTTKDGMMNSRAQVNVTFENTYVTPMNFPEFVDGATWMELYNEAQAARTPGAVPVYVNEQIENTRRGVNPYVFPNVNWRDVLFSKGNDNQRLNVNVQGGGSRVTYYMSLQVNHDTGIIKSPKNYYFDNSINNWGYTFQNNIAYNLTKTTKVELRMNAQIRSQSGPGTNLNDIFGQMYYANPIAFPATFPEEEGDGHIRFGNAILSGDKLRTNPYAMLLSSHKQYNENTLNTTFRLFQDLDIIAKGLKFQTMVNWKNWSESAYWQNITPYYYRVKDGSWNPYVSPAFETELLGTPGTDFIAEGDPQKNNDQTFYFDARLTYNRTFFKKHTIGALLMYMQREYRRQALPERNQGLSGRLTYDYDQRYWFEFNFGYNGTERLPKGHRFEFFPAMSIGWVPSNEKFWKPIEPFVSYMKLRGSLGLTGSDDTGMSAGAERFLFFDKINLGNGPSYTTGPSSEQKYEMKGPSVNGFAVKNATWERVRKLDIGVDMYLLNQFNFTFDYFFEHRYNILLKRGAWPVMMGYWGATPWSNIGSVDNWGYELSLNWRKKLAKDFNIDVRANFTYTQNKYKDVDEPAYPYVWQTQTGKPLSMTKGYIAEGLFKDQAEIDASPVQNLGSTVMPGDIKYRDVDGDGIVNENDQVMISPYGYQPRIQYGLGLNMNYKRFDFGVFFNGSAKRTIMISGLTPFGENNNNVIKFVADDYWSVNDPNPDAKYPRLGLTWQQVANNMQNSTYWMRNGSFIRFKTLEFGYTVKYGRLYFNIDNVAVWSPFKLWDPELSWNAYPLSRSFNIGLQLKF